MNNLIRFPLTLCPTLPTSNREHFQPIYKKNVMIPALVSFLCVVVKQGSNHPQLGGPKDREEVEKVTGSRLQLKRFAYVVFAAVLSELDSMFVSKEEHKDGTARRLFTYLPTLFAKTLVIHRDVCWLAVTKQIFHCDKQKVYPITLRGCFPFQNAFCGLYQMDTQDRS